ncbi:restriction endonuclease subunit S [Zoogloea sp.]|uniref:restriction endonuclease subunit S n=1 Tax=Zoogloea sp. TaxID=49181 RepID=UPI0026107B11|nr:restriction endonuclease subunit S [uncultured Zoogloea sp.]
MSWPVVTLDSIKADVPYACVGGPFGSNLTSKHYVHEGVPVIRGQNLGGPGCFDESGFVFVTPEKADQLRSNLAYRGDILFTQRGTLGQVGLIPKDSKFDRYVVSQSQMKLTVDASRVDARYVYQYFRLESTVQEILNRTITAGVPHINLGILKSFEIPLPPLPFQQAIAEVAQAYDDLIATNQRRIALLEDAARRLYREWFVHLRFAGHESVPVKNGVPEGWRKTPIVEQTSFFNRGIAPKYDDTAKGRVINQKCIRDGRISMAPARRQSKDVKPDRQLLMGDVLINSTGAGTLGRVAQVRAPIKDCTVDTHVTIARPIDKGSSTYFGQALLNLEPVFSEMGKGATNQLELSRSDIGSIEIWQPPQHLHAEFHRIVWPMLEQAEQLSIANLSLQKVRDLLLPKLMSGQLDVSGIPLPDNLPA